MKLPAFLHGPYAEVKTRCRKKVKALAAGATWDEFARDWLDIAECPGLLLLEGPSPLPHVKGQPHFQPFVLGQELLTLTQKVASADEVRWRAFHAALGSPWGLLCFMGQHSYSYVRPAEPQWRFLEACARRWAELDGAGERYCNGGIITRLWSLPTMIHFALARRGQPAPVLNGPLPPEGLAPLVEQVRQARLLPARTTYVPDKPTTRG